MTGTLDYRQVNAAAWRYLARHGSDSSQPYDPEHLLDRERSRSSVDPCDWLPWPEIRTVLCLAAGGGQQGPCFAALGCEVTVVDLSADQLAIDRAAAHAVGVDLECIQADMQDLSVLAGRRFDLVHQPISTCYVPDVMQVYRQVRSLLDEGGWYDVEHWNPVHAQLSGYGTWSAGGYTIEHPQLPGRPVPWYLEGEDGTVTCWHYVHRFEDLVGGICRAGFRIVQAAQRADGDPDAAPDSLAHLSAYAPAFLRLLCRASRR